MKNSVAKKALTGLLFWGAASFVTTSCTVAPEGNSANGERWFSMQHCGSCHGRNGTGGRAPEIQGVGLSYRVFKAKVRDPQSASMPAYSTDRLSEKELADIFAFLSK